MIDAFKLGVSLSLTDNVSSGAAVIARQMLGVGNAASSAQSSILAAKVALGGFVAIAAGGALLGMTAALAASGRELLNEQALLRATGATAVEVAQSSARAWEVAGKLIGTSVSDNLRQITNLRNVFGDLGTAETLLPEFQRSGQLLKATTGKDSSAEVGHLARFVEMRGKASNPEDFKREMDALTTMFVATRGAVAPRELVNFMQRAGAAGRALSTESMATLIPSLIQASGSGDIVGTQLAAMRRQVIGGIMTRQQAETMSRYGLLEKSGPARTLSKRDFAEAKAKGLVDKDDSFSSFRQHVVVNPRSVPNRADASTDPYAWINKNLNAEFKKLDTNGQLDAITRMFGSETSRRFAGFLTQNRVNIDKDRENYNRTASAAESRGERVGDDLLRDSPTLAVDRVGVAFNNLFTALGTPAAKLSVDLLNGLAGGVTAINQVLVANPMIAQTLVGVSIGLGAALVVLGGIAVVGAAVAFIGGGVVAGVLAIGAAFGVLAAVISSVKLSDVLDGIGIVFRQFGETISGWTTRIGEAIAGFAATSAQAIQAVVEFVSALPGKVLSGLGGLAGSALGAAKDAVVGMPNRILGSGEPAAGAAPTASRISYAPVGRGAGPERIEVPVVLDGREITRVVTDRQARDASGPGRGTSRFDGRMSPLHPGAAFNT